MSLLVIKTSLFVILLAISCVMIFAGKLIVIMLHSKIRLKICGCVCCTVLKITDCVLSKA